MRISRLRWRKTKCYSRVPHGSRCCETCGPLQFAGQQVDMLGHDDTQAAEKPSFGWSGALALH